MSDRKHSGKPLLSLHNHHIDGCGAPPYITEKPGHYIGYFENQLGEQAIFVFDRTAQVGAVLLGNCGWEIQYPVIEGMIAGLVLPEAERAWLRTCWEAATGQRLQPTLVETFTDLLRAAETTSPAALARLKNKIDTL